MSGGKIVRIAGGKIITHCENLTYYQNNFTINAGGKIELTTDGEMIYGEPEKPPTGGKYIIKGWWSSDEKGNIQIKEAYPGDIVYFQIETKNIPDYEEKNDAKDPDLSRLFLRFWDQEAVLGFDNLKPDRELKGGPEEAEVKENRATAAIQIMDHESIIKMIREEDDNALEVYCTVTYQPKSLIDPHSGFVFQREDLPTAFGDYLKIRLPELPDLYYIRPDQEYQFPELRTQQGNAIFMQILLHEPDHIQDRLDKAKDKIKDKIKDSLKDKLELKERLEQQVRNLKQYSYTLAVRELEKGSLMYTSGQVIQRKNVYAADITMIDGNVQSIKRASNTGFRIADPKIEGETRYATTKGLNQLEVFARKNPIHTAANLGMKVLETLSFVIDVQGMEQSMASGEPDYKGMGNLVVKKFFGFFPSWVGRLSSALSIPVALMVDEFSKRFEEDIDKITFQTFLEKKEEGMESMEKFLQYDKPNKTIEEERITELGFRFLYISNLTLQKLLAKEFKTFKELDDFNFGSKEEHGIVHRGIWNHAYKRFDTFIYCIFINEESLN